MLNAARPIACPERSPRGLAVFARHGNHLLPLLMIVRHALRFRPKLRRNSLRL